jgi:hypothetical protein
MTSQLVALRVDANDPLPLAAFWAGALGWEIGDGTRDEIDLVPTDGTRFVIRFVPVVERKVGKNCIHLDLTTASIDDQTATVRTLLAAGARHTDVGQGPHDAHVVLADPEGNELCIIEPGNSFLAGCGRLGSITCDGSRDVGCFWSAALGWPLVWDQDDETAVRAPDGSGPFITWGPPVPPTPTRNRLRLELAPATPGEPRAEVDRLVSLGATRLDRGDASLDRVLMLDPDGNEFWVASAPAWRGGSYRADPGSTHGSRCDRSGPFPSR